MEKGGLSSSKGKKGQEDPPPQSSQPPRKKRRGAAKDGPPEGGITVQVDPLIQALRRIDPLLQFLCKATGQVMVDWTLIHKSLPVISLSELQSLHEYGVLRVLNEQADNNNEESHDPHNQEKGWKVGFPPPPLTTEATTSTTSTTTPTSAPTPLLHGSTKRAAQQRVSWLTKQLRQKQTAKKSELYTKKHAEASSSSSISPPPKNTPKPVAVTTDAQMPATTTTPPLSPHACISPQDTVDLTADERQALKDIRGIFGWSDADDVTKSVGDETAPCETIAKSAVPTGILPRQISFAGSQAAQPAIYASLQAETLGVPDNVYRALVPVDKPLYRHQVEAITAALKHNKHVSLTTGTGSGKSLAFLFPVITTVVKYNRRAMLLFPTKALAQDQITKLQALADRLDQPKALRPATLDGDTPHSQRKAIAESANLILTNPDTLHAAILPNWEKGYTQLLAELAFVVVDEAHCYQGVFGAHVALILSRLRRLCAVARARNENDDRDFHAEASLRFITASATLPWPEVHVRKICPIGKKEALEIIDQDTSARAAKHFFVWNPPLLSAQGASSRSVVAPCRSKKKTSTLTNSGDDTTIESGSHPHNPSSDKESSLNIESSKRLGWRHREPEWHRRHAADETALLLARSVIQGRRTIAFAKTRNLVEWIFERTLAALKSDPATAHLVGKVESYRGGYTRIERRKIEDRLFRNDLLGVVGTNALELGVDVGGIDLTLHCGYPSSYASLLQQAGRAGRGRSQSTSCAVVVCFNSPSEQHLWRYPCTLLSKGLTPTDTIPLNKNTVQSHLLCASAEFPLTGKLPAECIITETAEDDFALSDWDLFGGQKLYEDALEEIKTSCTTEEICLPSEPSFILHKAHPLLKKAWSSFSIRSIEPVNYSIVDLSHPRSGGRTDGIYDEQAVLDTLPYSRVFYHAHPGAIITHRGTRYKVVSMTRPPEVLSDPNLRFRRNMQLSAFAKPTSARYSTRPLSRMDITIIKQFESIQLNDDGKAMDSILNAAEKRSCSKGEVRCYEEGGFKSSGGSKEEKRQIELVEPKSDTTSASEDVVPDNSSRENSETLATTSFCGCGVVNVKRTVHGYKKLSLITRTELSRSELSLPDMEFETFGLWFDTDPCKMTASLGSKYGEGVHALAHAILAVAPLFEPGLVRDDLECDHSYVAPTRLVLFDERAGGSGSCERLWKHFFLPENNIIDAALNLLRSCESCAGDDGYEGGCPACLHAPQCLKFNMNLSRTAAIVLGVRMLERIKTTDLYRMQEHVWKETKRLPPSPSRNLTPRRKARHQALKRAKEIRTAQSRQYVVGRPSFVPTEGGNIFFGDQQEHE